MCAKVLVPSSDQTEVGSLARIERLERRIGMGGAEAPVSTPAPVTQAAPARPATAPSAPAPSDKTEPIKTVAPATAAAPAPRVAPAQIGAVTATQVRDAWSEILSKVNKQSKSAWMVAFSLTVVDFADEILTLKFLSQNDLDAFKNASGASDILRKAIAEVLGIQVKFKAQIEASTPVASAPAASTPAPAVSQAPGVSQAQAAQAKTAPINIVHTEAPDDYEPEPEDDEPVVQVEAPKAVEPAEPAKSRNGMVDESARYGESLLREMLGAEPIADKNAGK
jgi:DNA polymerase-3 subunit gamma/tau